MRKNTSYILSKIFSSKTLLLSVCLTLLLSLVPTQFVGANIFGDILGAVTNITAAIFFGPLILGVTGGLYFLAFLASWLVGVLIEVIKVVALSSLSIPVLPNSGINVVTVGWEFTRDFVNLLFILILVFMGLATILRMQSYGLQKTLPLLIVVALLVNFSGVFVGFIVDIANLVTSGFVQKIQGLSFGLSSTLAIGKGVVQDLLGFITHLTDIGSIVVPAAKALVLLLFYAALALILFVVMLLFIVRVGMLWLLTILAPLAFAAYILPATKKLTAQWFQQLIQWAIIGIPMSFFLWLAQIAIVGAPDISAAFRGRAPTLTGPDPGLAQLIMSLTGPVVALLILGTGVAISMQFAPATSKAIINIGKSKGGRKLFRRAVGGAGSFAWTRKLPNFVGGKSIGEVLGGRGTSGGLGTSISRWAEDKMPGVGLGTWVRQFGRAIDMGAGKITEQIQKGKRDDFEEAEKAKLHQPSLETVNNMNLELQKPPVSQNLEAMAGMFGGIVKNTDANDMYDYTWPQTGKPKRFEWENMLRMFQATVLLGPPFYRENAKANIGRLLELAKTPAIVARGQTPQDFIREILERVTRDDIIKEVPPKQYLNPYYINPNDPHAQERAAWVIDNLVNATVAKPEVGPALLATKRDVRENVEKYLQTKDLNWFVENHAERIVRATHTSTELQALGVARLLPTQLPLLETAVLAREAARERPIQAIIALLTAAGIPATEARARAVEQTRPPIAIPTWI